MPRSSRRKREARQRSRLHRFFYNQGHRLRSTPPQYRLKPWLLRIHPNNN